MTSPIRWIAVAGLYVLLLTGGWIVGYWFQDVLEAGIASADQASLQMTIIMVVAIFILVSALPFVPGAEIGLGLMLVFGGKIALLVYMCMIVALTLSFLIGRFVPVTIIAGIFSTLGMMRARHLAQQFAPLGAKERLELLVSRAPRRFVPTLLRHRYVALAILLNIPGNSIIGGGGGLAFTAGLSGLFSLFGFVAAIAVAVAPVPLFFYMMD